jgi:hypothetical protein
VRARHSLGGPDAGGDLPRIELQQAFISSVVQKVNQEGLLSNIPALLGVANTATQALTVDQGLGSVSSLMHLAESLAHLKSKNVSLITMPTTTDTWPGLSAHLMPVEPQDDVLFQMIDSGQQWTGALPVQAYSSVQVKVLNATGRSGLAAQTAQQLQQLGFHVVGTGDAPYSSTTTVQYAGTAQADAAYTVGAALTSFPAGQNIMPEAATNQVGSPGPVTLVVGADFNGIQPAKVVSPTPSATAPSKSSSTGTTVTAANPAPTSGASAVQSRNAGASICSGLPPAYSPG